MWEEVLGIDGLGLLLSFGGWLLYWRKGPGDRLCGVFLVSRFTMIPTGSSISLGPSCLKEYVKEAWVSFPCMKLVENKISLIRLNHCEYCIPTHLL